MAGIVDDGEVGAVDSGQIVAELAFELQLGEILGDENLEAGKPERGGYILGILGRVLQRRDVAVIGIADDERDPPIGAGLERREAGEDEDRDESAKSEHGKTPGNRRLKPTKALCGISPLEYATCHRIK